MVRIIPIAVVGLALVLYALWRGAYPDLFEEGGPPPAETTAEAPAAPGTPAAATAPAPDEPPLKPELDVVRINEDGDTVIAGKAEPGASVTVATQDGPLATVKADERGNWVALPDEPLPAGDHAVTIESTGKNGKKDVGDKTIVVSIPEGTGGKPLVVAAPTRNFGASEVIQRPESPPGAETPAAPPAGSAAPAAQQQAPPAGKAAPATAGTEETRVAAGAPGKAEAGDAGADRPAGRQAAAGGDASGGERAQTPAAIAATAPEKPQPTGAAPAAIASAAPAPAPEAAQAPPGGVSVDSVDYDDKGNLALSGTAKPGSIVEPKIAGAESGSESLGKVRADEKGKWRLRVERPVAPGRYDLTVEERSPGGAPRSRIRLPFERADPIAGFPPGGIVVVQPGNSLWRIARRIYGQGVRYTVIYAANRAQIGDPDLIFPGQIFSVPEGGRAARAPG